VFVARNTRCSRFQDATKAITQSYERTPLAILITQEGAYNQAA